MITRTHKHLYLCSFCIWCHITSSLRQVRQKNMQHMPWYYKWEKIKLNKNQFFIHRHYWMGTCCLWNASLYMTKVMQINSSSKRERDHHSFQLLRGIWCCHKTVSTGSIFFLQPLLAIALKRGPTRLRVVPLNHVSSPYILTEHILVTTTFLCMSTM